MASGVAGGDSTGLCSTAAIVDAQACELAALLVLTDPAGLGGLSLRAPPGPWRSAWLRQLQDQAAALGPVVRMPHRVDLESLCGGLDWTLSLAQGSAVRRAGLLERADKGVLLVSMAEQIPRDCAGLLAQALDRGTVPGDPALESRFALLMLDEALEDERGPPAILSCRLAFHLLAPQDAEVPGADLGNALAADRAKDLAADRAKDLAADRAKELAADRAKELVRARALLGGVRMPDTGLNTIAMAAARLGVADLRALHFTLRAACVLAALRALREPSQQGTQALEPAVVDEDLISAIALVLAPRATRLPSADAASAQNPHDGSSSSGRDDGDQETPMVKAEARLGPEPAEDKALPQSSRGPDRKDPEDRRGEANANANANANALLAQAVAVAAQKALLPEALRTALGAPALPRTSPLRGVWRAGAGRSPHWTSGGLRGRVLSVRQGVPGSRARLNLLATLRAAAPWQRLRQPEDFKLAGQALEGTPGPSCEGAALEVAAPQGAALCILREDLRVNRYAQRQPCTTVFVVDASGSSALHRLAEAKGAVELLLAECYVRRDEVAVIAFRLDQAEVLLPPTRSLLRAKRRLAALPGGGGTPLASALERSAALLASLFRKGQGVQMIVLSDGKANVDREGRPGRERAMAQAHEHARGLAALAWGRAQLAWVDTAPRPSKEAQALASSMRAVYTALPYADAAGIHALARRMAQSKGH